VCRAMTGVAGLALLGMTAPLAGAQTVEVKERIAAVQGRIVLDVAAGTCG
jgi:hypothetical protein